MSKILKNNCFTKYLKNPILDDSLFSSFCTLSNKMANRKPYDSFTEKEISILKEASSVSGGNKSLMLFFTLCANYKESKAQDYILSKNLKNIFVKENIKFKNKMLFGDFIGYIKTPGVQDQDGFYTEDHFVNVRYVEDEGWVFGVVSLIRHPGPIPGILINDIHLSKFENFEDSIDFNGGHDSDLLKILANSVMYIKSTDDYKINFNQTFIKMKKDRLNIKNSGSRMYYLKPNVRLLPVYSQTNCEVSGHFRWQPYGPGKTKTKLIFINPYVKNYKNVKGVINE
jgi:hypothetical protein